MAGKATQDGSSKKPPKANKSHLATKSANFLQQSSPTTTTGGSNSSDVNNLSTQNSSIVSYSPSNQISSKSIIESANELCSKTIGPNSDNLVNNEDSTSQLRSTLAIGQLIASNRPTAGSRLIASELRQLTKTIADESAVLRREIANLSTKLSDSLKSIMDEEREQRSMSSYRRPMFAQLTRKSINFPTYRRRRAGFAMKQGSAGTDVPTASTSTLMPPRTPTGENAANKSTSPTNANKRATTSRNVDARKRASTPNAHKLASLSAKLVNPARALGALFKNGWPVPDQVFLATSESDTDTDSTDTNPSPSP